MRSTADVKVGIIWISLDHQLSTGVPGVLYTTW